MNKLIAIAGSGWGFRAAYDSLKNKFDAIELVTQEDTENLNKRPVDVLLNDIEEIKSELLVCAGFKPIISSSFLLSKTVVNIHYSLLPKYRGFHSAVWAILNNEEYLGYTIHLMNENIDDGPILYQYKKKNNQEWTATDFMEHFNAQVSKVLGSVILNYLEGSLKPKKQNKKLATWVGKRGKQHCMVDFNKSFDYTKRFFRALVNPYPLPYFVCKGIEYEIISFELISINTISEPGRILNIEENGIYVSMPEGYFLIKKLAKNGKMVGFKEFKIGLYLNKV